MAYKNNGQDGGRLAQKLASEYRNRGSALKGIQATSTAELVERAQKSGDPRGNVSAEAFNENLRGRGNGGYRPQTGGGQRSNGAPRADANGMQSGGAAQRSSASGDGRRSGNVPGAGPRNGRGRSGGTRTFSGESANRGAPGGQSGPRRDPRARNEQVQFASRMAEETEDVFQEIQVEKKRLNPTFLVILALSTVLILMIVISIAQLYQSVRDVSQLERSITEIKETIDDLELKLDEKNDIRMIEQIATTELGMVKEDSLQKKYISLSDGERVDVIETVVEDEGGGTLLSGLFSVFDDFFEYFK